MFSSSHFTALVGLSRPDATADSSAAVTSPTSIVSVTVWYTSASARLTIFPRVILASFSRLLMS